MLGAGMGKHGKGLKQPVQETRKAPDLTTTEDWKAVADQKSLVSILFGHIRCLGVSLIKQINYKTAARWKIFYSNLPQEYKTSTGILEFTTLSNCNRRRDFLHVPQYQFSFILQVYILHDSAISLCGQLNTLSKIPTSVSFLLKKTLKSWLIIVLKGVPELKKKKKKAGADIVDKLITRMSVSHTGESGSIIINYYYYYYQLLL